jgi:hypothetical protein
MSILHFNHMNTLYFSPLLFSTSSLLFSSFQCFLLCHLPTQRRCISILFTLYIFFSHYSLVPQTVPLLQTCITCLYMSIYSYISHINKTKTNKNNGLRLFQYSEVLQIFKFKSAIHFELILITGER